MRENDPTGAAPSPNASVEAADRRTDLIEQPTARVPEIVRSARIVAPAAPATGLEPMAILNAFRRRWLIAVGLGLAAGLAAAAVVWFVIDTPYTAISELKIASVEQKLLFPTAEEHARFETYKQTQMRLVKYQFVLNAALRDPNVANLSMIREQEHPIDWLEENLKVASPATEFIRVSLSGEKPRELAAIVNAVTDAYLKEVVNAEQEERRGRMRSLEAIFGQKDGKLRRQYEALYNFAKSLHTTDSDTLNVKQQMAIEYNGQLRKEIATLRFELIRAEISLKSGELTTSDAEEAEVPESLITAYLTQEPEYERLSTRVSRREEAVSQWETSVGKENNRYHIAQRKLDKANEQLDSYTERMQPIIAERIQNKLSTDLAITQAELEERVRLLSLQKEQLEAELANQETVEKTTGIRSFELDLLNKNIEQSEAVTAKTREEIDHLEIETQSPPRVTLLREADVPYLRDTSKQYRLSAAAGLGLLGFVVVGAVFLEYHAHRISSLREVVDTLSLRVVGSLPKMSRRQAKNAHEQGSAWESTLIESIDSARTMLLSASHDRSLNIVMIASAAGNEGKTTLACQLASSLARAGRETLLVDCDLRQPSIHDVFHTPTTPGLCEVLSGKAELEQALRPTGAPGLTVLPAGQISPEVQRRLAQDNVRQVFSRLGDEFDYVIVDSSPLLSVSDPLLIAQYVDAVLFSIRRDVSRVAKVAAACERLSMLKIPLLGAVVIGVDDSGYDSRYSYGYPVTPDEQKEPA